MILRVLAFLTLALLPGTAVAGRETALDRYVRSPDPSFAWHPVSVIEGSEYRAHVLELTSQTWRAPHEVDRTVWKHWVTVVVPRSVRHRTALLYLSGGRTESPIPSEANPVLARIAVATGAVTVLLQQVPNQPLLFAGDGEPRREDALIARAWERYLHSGDATWLPRLPMTKSAVRAMDATIAFCDGEAIDIESFVVAGSSKRGWTAWTTAAVDPRVVGVVPMVIDLLNVEASFRHHFRSYGSWSPAIREYVDAGIPDWFGSDEFRALRGIEDPFTYRKRLTMPKLVVNATGDPFFLPDSSRFYVDGLRGETHLLYVPNADHTLNGSDAFDVLLAFFRAIAEGVPRPSYRWHFAGESSIRVRTDPVRPPAEVRLWRASNPEGRDFRLETIGATWTAMPLAPSSDGSYHASVAPPARGYTAFFVELTYPGTGDEPLRFTTGVRVIPDRLPYDPPVPRNPRR